MNRKNIFISHQKSRSINNNLALKDIKIDNNLMNFQGNNNNLNYNYKNMNLNKVDNKKDTEIKNINNIEEKNNDFDLGKTIEEINQNILDLYYDKNSLFKKRIDDLNLKFYLETEKYLNNSKNNNHILNQKIHANLFIILFKQIKIFIQEIERLNKIILDNKFRKEKILERTNELNLKNQNFLIKDNFIQYLKKSNTNIEKKLLESLLKEDKLVKDNERLRKENETYKTLTLAIKNEFKNTIKKRGLTPEKNLIFRHIKTYSDYEIERTTNFNELSGNNIPVVQKFQTLNNESKILDRDKKNLYYNRINDYKGLLNQKNYYSINVDKNNKSKCINKYIKDNKIQKNHILTVNNSIQNKKSFNKLASNNKIKTKQSQDNKSKIKFSKINNNNNINKFKVNKNEIYNNFEYNKNGLNSYNNKKLNFKKKNHVINVDSISNNINSTINSNTMTETNSLSLEKSKNKKIKNLGMHKKQKTMSEISFNESERVQILNAELSNIVKNNGSNNNRTKINKNEVLINDKKLNNFKNNYRKI